MWRMFLMNNIVNIIKNKLNIHFLYILLTAFIGSRFRQNNVPHPSSV